MSEDYNNNSADWCDVHAVTRHLCRCEYEYDQPVWEAWNQASLSVAELAELPAPKPLIDNTLDLRSVALLAGPWSSGKTFLALDWALCVASGKPWQGREVHTSTFTHNGKTQPSHLAVLYVAAEGVYGIKQRVAAWQAAWNSDGSRELHNVTFLPTPVRLGSGQVNGFAEFIHQYGYEFVIIDTLARCAVGLDENSAKDAGLIVRDLDRIRAATNGGTVLAIHHTGKDGKTVRGSSAIEAAMDTVYQIEGDAQLMKLRRTKRKDGPTPDNLALRLEPVPGTDSVVVSGGKVDMTPTVDRLMSTFVQAFEHSGATKADLRAAVDMSPGSFHRAVNRALQDSLLVNVGTDQRPFYRLAGEAK